MLGVALAAIGFLAYKMSQDGTWTIADTMEDVTDPANAQKIVDRTEARRIRNSSGAIRAVRQLADALDLPPAGARAAAASLLSALTFSLLESTAPRQVGVDRRRASTV